MIVKTRSMKYNFHVQQKYPIYYTYRRMRVAGIDRIRAKHLISMTLIGAGV